MNAESTMRLGWMSSAANRSRSGVHFHLDGDGREFVCDLDRCDSPAVGVADVRGHVADLRGHESRVRANGAVARARRFLGR